MYARSAWHRQAQQWPPAATSPVERPGFNPAGHVPESATGDGDFQGRWLLERLATGGLVMDLRGIMLYKIISGYQHVNKLYAGGYCFLISLSYSV